MSQIEKELELLLNLRKGVEGETIRRRLLYKATSSIESSFGFNTL